MKHILEKGELCRNTRLRISAIRQDMEEYANKRCTLVQAQYKAQAIEKLIEQMQYAIVEFVHIRTNGEREIKQATLLNYERDLGQPYRENPKNPFLPYYDTEKECWNTCRIANIELIQ